MTDIFEKIKIKLDPERPTKIISNFKMLPVLFSLPEGLLAEMMTYVGAIFDDAKLLIILAIGIPLAFFMIKKAIALIPSR
ncbi:unnamed protein product [marine sediment metagenome]|uniref:Uncharacterized protein n=1 Tax=marine sediment metagenome TaxID=412755 RepID=X1RRJ4_9ZZZZ